MNAITNVCRTFSRRHPLLVQAMIWAIPAVLVALAVRALLMIYLPYALWGADSKSYFSFAQRLLVQHEVSMDEKRRYLYPLLLVPLSLLPGIPLRNVAIIQHALGALAIFPLAYAIRKTLFQWRWWVIPITVLYALFPVTFLFEHELVGECLFFNALLWAFAGWQAWISQTSAARARRMYWWFLIPLAVFILTKPAGRFVWPGLVIAFFFLRHERWRLGRLELAGTALLLAVTPLVGSKKHGSLMLYTAAFPLTQLETPKHAEYKAEIREMVKRLQRYQGEYYMLDEDVFDFIYRGRVGPEFPHWAKLAHDPDRRAPLCLDLALEGMRAHPLQVFYFGLQRLIASANLSAASYEAFGSGYFRRKEKIYFDDAAQFEKSGFRLANRLPLHGPLPPYEEFAPRFECERLSWPGALMRRIVDRMSRFDLVRLPEGAIGERAITRARPTALGWLFLAGLCFCFLPDYRHKLGAWVIISSTYLIGTFAFSEVNFRHFAPTWPVVLLLMVIPADYAIREACDWRHRRRPARPSNNRREEPAALDASTEH